MLGRSRIHTRARGSGAGAGSTTTTDLQRILALSPSLLVWPAQGAGWQGTSGGTLAASGQPLGLGADLSQLQGKTLSEWLVAPTTSELVTNGDFATDTGWTKDAGWAISGGTLNAASVANGSSTYQNIPSVVDGNVYVVTFTLSSMTAGAFYANFFGGSTGPAVAANGTYTHVIRAPVSANDNFGMTALGTTSGSIVNISVRELPGNHLRAGTWASPSDSARGTFQNNAINFGGVDDYYSLLNAINITTNMTVVRAFKRASAGINSNGLAEPADAAYEAFQAVDDKTYLKLGATTLDVANASTGTGSFVLSSLRNATNQFFRRNGTQISSVSAPAVTGTLAEFGRRGGNYNSGEISFLALFPSELTGADLTLVEQIAASTNGATLS